MILKITRKNAEELGVNFESLINSDFVDESYREHRRDSNFYTKSILEINSEFFPELPRELDGFWETNTYIDDDTYGANLDEIYELTRVEKKEKVVTTYEWKPVSK